ncbi:DOPA 4,5-dioxygenase family protein [Pseudomonas cichorii]|uniref:DOPA 4,5-dioxygenase family protein n=1 Tax=Pseudomonas lijiangensis TaxID=2995658 RepID=A0ABX8HSB6_9PSED|nr:MULTISPECIES: DOPA 4,5-dioxygenase family protein [Pseudomonas syringae group]MBX8492199.1 DOPA 4,5-dioxygenase family protein [Pseudomonas cichorii]MBX8502555.1 DOPA 4,5-dioxygenase family protein [Pseudomonas lijiangensis]MBX8507503.1 DOPA 4,5-dioxygenase family protein [Pseudomonas lijiangensis]MBX8520788.1 DOPA 4,5-dioxygenase family protein [Pseudomonas cichorii]MBX8539315.1 DOPA 4,5-dioxygenase family protein [Pseudomonas cichorii]
MQDVQGYHAHIYFDARTIGLARALCEAATAKFDVQMGRVHERLVGPHPDWSCQLAFGHSQFADVMLWLALNRNDLVVFVHPLTGDELKDHTEHAIWMGEIRPLDVSIFKA